MAVALTSIESFSCWTDRHSFCWSFEASLTDLAEWKALAIGSDPSEIEVAIRGRAMRFLVESKQCARAMAEGGVTVSYRISGRQKTARLGDQYAAALTQVFGFSSAAGIIHALCEPAGITSSFEIDDWALPDGVLAANNEAPLAIIKRLAEAAGAALRTSDDGGTLRIVPLHAENPALMTESDLVLTFDEIESLSCERERRPGFNAVMVGAINPARDAIDRRLSVEQEPIFETQTIYTVTVRPGEETWANRVTDALRRGESWGGDGIRRRYGGLRKTGDVRISLFVTPWADIEQIEVLETGNFQLLYSGALKEYRLNEVWIIDGAGSLSCPFHGYAGDVRWVAGVPQTLRIDESGAITSDDTKPGLVRIPYFTRFHSYLAQMWHAPGPINSAEASGAVVFSVPDETIRSDLTRVVLLDSLGDRLAPDVIDPLLIQETVRIARGKVELYENATDVEVYAMSLAYSRAIPCGARVGFVDEGSGEAWIGQCVSERIDAALPDIRHTIEIERRI